MNSCLQLYVSFLRVEPWPLVYKGFLLNYCHWCGQLLLFSFCRFQVIHLECARCPRCLLSAPKESYPPLTTWRWEFYKTFECVCVRRFSSAMSLFPFFKYTCPNVCMWCCKVHEWWVHNVCSVQAGVHQISHNSIKRSFFHFLMYFFSLQKSNSFWLLGELSVPV